MERIKRKRACWSHHAEAALLLVILDKYPSPTTATNEQFAPNGADRQGEIELVLDVGEPADLFCGVRSDEIVDRLDDGSRRFTDAHRQDPQALSNVVHESGRFFLVDCPIFHGHLRNGGDGRSIAAALIVRKHHP